jgi:hypothetical protein
LQRPIGENSEELSMANHFSDHAVERSLLLSSSYEMWRRRQQPYPIYVPAAAKGVMPQSLSQCTSEFARGSGRCSEHVRGTVYRQLDRYHPERPWFYDRTRAPSAKGNEKVPSSRTRVKAKAVRESMVVPAVAPFAAPLPDIDIEFQDDISTVTVSAVFGNVSRDDAICILELAKPKNWRIAVPSFFPEIIVGETFVDGQLQPFKNPNSIGAVASDINHLGGVLSDDPPLYQIREQVEWHWKPETTGGAINILEINDLGTPFKDRFGGERSNFAAKILERITLANAPDKIDASDPFDRIPEKNSPAEFKLAPLVTAYSYELVRCLQSRLLSSWEIGGLDVDDGTYTGLWVPSLADETTGTLYVEALKSIRYSLQADVFAGFSQILNMLAPSVESTIMNQLAYESTRQFLEQRAKGTSPSEIIGAALRVAS